VGLPNKLSGCVYGCLDPVNHCGTKLSETHFRSKLTYTTLDSGLTNTCSMVIIGQSIPQIPTNAGRVINLTGISYYRFF